MRAPPSWDPAPEEPSLPPAPAALAGKRHSCPPLPRDPAACAGDSARRGSGVTQPRVRVRGCPRPPRPAWGRPWKCIPQNSCVSGSESRRASPGPESRPCITSEGWAARAPEGAPRVYRTRPGLWKPKAVSEEGEQGSVPETRRREGRRASSPLKQRDPGTRRRNWGRRDAQKVLGPRDTLLGKMGLSTVVAAR